MKLSWFHIAILVTASALPFGCRNDASAPPPAAPTQGSPGGGTAASPFSNSGVNMGNMPMAAPTTKKPSLAEAVAQAPKLDPKLVPLEKAYSAAAATLKQKPNDPAAKKAFVEAAYSFGHAAEYSDTLEPTVKYRAALLLYRKALAVDPKHEATLAEKNQIEDIYRTMPGGIPQ